MNELMEAVKTIAGRLFHIHWCRNSLREQCDRGVPEGLGIMAGLAELLDRLE